MIKAVYYNGKSLAFIGGSCTHSIEQRLKLMISPLPSGYKRLYLTELKDNVNINLELIKKYYIEKYEVENFYVRSYNW